MVSKDLIGKFIHRGLLCTVLLLMSCGGGMSDIIWTQKKMVTVKRSEFVSCISKAIDEVPNVSVDHLQSNTVNIALDVALKKPIPFLTACIQIRPNDSAEIIFAGRGARETDEERAAITPLIESIATAISKTCNGNGAHHDP